MRVLWFSNTPANGVHFLGDRIVRGGWLKSLDVALQSRLDLHVAFYYPRRNEPFKYLQTHYYPLGIKHWKRKALVHAIRPGITDVQDIPRYLEIINTVKPDVIHIHGSENPFGSVIPHTDIPVVISMQGVDTVYHHKYRGDFSAGDLREGWFSRSPKSMLREHSLLQNNRLFKKRGVRERKNLFRAGHMIGRTAWDRRIASVLAPGATYYHCDEILRESFYQSQWKQPDSDKLILFSTLGNTPYKGFETIAEALYVLNNLLGTRVEWRIAGIDENDMIVKAARKKLKRRFPSGGLIFLGQLDGDNLCSALCEAGIYVSPSHIENSSNSLCEALLLGVPAVATFAGGTGSLLEDGKEGILIQDGDPWVMAGAILELYDNPTLAVAYGKRAGKRARKRHDPEKIVGDLIQIYEQIAGK